MAQQRLYDYKSQGWWVGEQKFPHDLCQMCYDGQNGYVFTSVRRTSHGHTWDTNHCTSHCYINHSVLFATMSAVQFKVLDMFMCKLNEFGTVEQALSLFLTLPFQSNDEGVPKVRR